MPDLDKTPAWVVQSRERWRSRFFATWAVIAIGIVLYYAGVLFGRISSAIWPFVVAFIITFLLKGPVAWVSDRFKIGRGAATAITIVALFTIFALVSIVFSPILGEQLSSFASSVTSYQDRALGVYQGAITLYESVQLPAWLQNVAVQALQSIGSLFSRLAEGAATLLIATGSGVLTGVFDLLLGLILAFWILKDLPKIVDVAEEFAGPAYGDDLDQLINTVNFTVGGYLKGQTVASLSTGLMAGVGLAIFGVPYALLIGVLAFFLNYVPYIGPFVTGLIAAVVAVLTPGKPWWLGLVAIGIVVAAQQLTDNLITPRVMSEQVDLHPTLVIFSLLVGGALFGFAGLLFAIPVAATGKGLFMYYWDRREHHPFSGPSGLVVADDDGSKGPSSAE